MSSTPKSKFWRGVRDGLPFVIVVGPFSVLFGVLATEAGIALPEAMGFSVLIIAGAAQFAALQQIVEGAPVAIVIATALAVNLRMAMYSAALVPHLGAAPLWPRALAAYLCFDQNYSMAMLSYEENPDQSPALKIAYFIGLAAPVAPSWVIGTYIGAVAGQQIPPGLALDFALPITFLAMIGPMLRTQAHVVAALVSFAVTLGLIWVPYNVGLLVAGIAAMVAGAEVERRKGA